MKLWKQILSAVRSPSASARLETGAIGNAMVHPRPVSVETARPAPRPYSETELYLIALSIGRATRGAT